MEKPDILDRLVNFSLKLLPEVLAVRLKNVDVELLKGSGIFFITKIIGIGFTYLFAWWAAKELGAGKWGFIALMITSINAITTFCLFGIDILLMKYTSEYRQKQEYAKLRELYKKSMVIVLIMLFVVIGSFGLFPEFFAKLLYGSERKLPWFIMVLIAVPAHVFFQINNSVLAGFKDMVFYGFYKNILLFGAGILVYIIGSYTIFPIFLERFIAGGILVLASYIGVIYCGLFFNSIKVIRNLELLSKKSQHSLNNKQLIKQSFPLLLTASMVVILTTTDYFMLSHFNTTVEIGLYDIAVKISVLNGIILMAVNAIATPKFAELFGNGNIKDLKLIVHQSSKMIFWSSLPILMVIMLFPKAILSMFGEEFIIAATTLVILSVGQFVNSICGSVGNLLKMTNNQGVLQYIILVSLIINIGLNFLLIPKYSYEGAAVASCISIIFWNLTSSYFAHKRLGIRTIYLPRFNR